MCICNRVASIRIKTLKLVISWSGCAKKSILFWLLFIFRLIRSVRTCDRTGVSFNLITRKSYFALKKLTPINFSKHTRDLWQLCDVNNLQHKNGIGIYRKSWNVINQKCHTRVTIFFSLSLLLAEVAIKNAST